MKYIFFPETSSTNDEAKAILRTSQTFPIVLVAEVQNKGRGQRSRSWESKEGGLYFSIVLKADMLQESWQSTLQQDVAKKVIRVINQLAGVDCELEWPNDIICRDKKLGGVLIETEASSSPDDPHYVIIGVGININQHEFSDDLRSAAVSLSQITGQHYCKDRFISALSKELSQW